MKGYLEVFSPGMQHCGGFSKWQFEWLNYYSFGSETSNILSTVNNTGGVQILLRLPSLMKLILRVCMVVFTLCVTLSIMEVFHKSSWCFDTFTFIPISVTSENWDEVLLFQRFIKSQMTSPHGGVHRNRLLNTDADKTTVWELSGVFVCDRRQTSTASWQDRALLTDVQHNGYYHCCWCDYCCHVIIGSTGELDTSLSMCVERERGREREREGERDRNFNWRRDECAKHRVYAFVFSAHVHLHLARSPWCVCPPSQWKPLNSRQSLPTPLHLTTDG